MFVTVLKGDTETAQCWRDIGVTCKIVECGEEDNFWSMGKTGPCGPCTEIFYDRGESYGSDDDRYLEIWNIVFMQFYMHKDGTQTNLDSIKIDTGMGLERIASVIQDKPTNYDIDTLSYIRSKLLAKVKIANPHPFVYFEYYYLL